MQFHLNGFQVGDPNVEAPNEHVRAVASGQLADLPDEVDVLIVGCGPAGLTLAAQLAAFPDITTCIVEQKAGPLELGQADGIACRTVEMFNAFGFAERVLREAYWVNETAFWRPSDTDRGRIVRGDRVQDTEDGLSEFPHVILNQARVHGFYLDLMQKSSHRMAPHYGWRLTGLNIDSATQPADYAVTAMLETSEPSGPRLQTSIRARYVVGCDGARSAVRNALGLELRGDSANQAWGVMDVLAVTDFPDIRLKCVITSATEGSIVLIPREGGYLDRIYVELDKLKRDERVSNRNITLDQIVGAARRVLSPYSLEVRDVAWWSVYEIGQRLCDRFDDVPKDQVGQRPPRVFIAGDACHTHSPKAGQGMNVSMQDAFNLGWKLAAVLRGQCPPQFLDTYSAERQSIAKELIDFDHEWATLLSAPVKPADDPEADGVDPAEVRDYFVRHGRYTAGTATRYAPSALTGKPEYQHLAKGFVIGTRFHSAPVVRLADARPMHLGHVIEADGRWRIFAFADAGHPAAEDSRIRKLCDFLKNSPDSPIVRITPADADIDSVIDVRAIFQQRHRQLDLREMPESLLPPKGKFALRDYEKMFCPAVEGGDIFDLREIDRREGCVVIVRPDQYVAQILPLTSFDEIRSYFEGFMLLNDDPRATRRRFGSLQLTGAW